ncbi:F-box only protein 22, partial [Harpegnathos saltator]
ENSEIIMVHSAGIILDSDEIEGKNKDILCAFLPKIPNVDIRIFQIPNPNSRRKEEGLIQTIKQLPALNKEKSTCLIIFGTALEHSHIKSLINDLNSYSNKISSVWGGLVKNCYIHDKTSSVLRAPYCISILITGRMKTWSTIVDQYCNTKEKVEKHLREWKEKVELRKHSIGFMFACHARGESLYNKPNVESSIFKSLFPDLKLVGCFGDGELGKHSFPADNCKTSRK